MSVSVAEQPQTKLAADDDEESGSGKVSKPELVMPDPLSGLVERKGGKKFMSSSWKQVYVIRLLSFSSTAAGVSSGFRCRFAAVTVPGSLHFYKDQLSMQNSRGDTNDIFDAIDLSLVLNFTVVEKKKGNAYLDLELVDETISFRYSLSCDVCGAHDDGVQIQRLDGDGELETIVGEVEEVQHRLWYATAECAGCGG